MDLFQGGNWKAQWPLLSSSSLSPAEAAYGKQPGSQG